MPTDSSKADLERQGQNGSESGVRTAALLYEYVGKLAEEHRAIAEQFLTKLDKLLIINTAFVGGIGWGAQQLGWTAVASCEGRSAVIFLVVLAVAETLWAYVSGIACLLLSFHEVPNVTALLGRVSSGECFGDSTKVAYQGIIQNMATTLIANRRRRQKVMTWSKQLNLSLLAGAFTVTLFLAVAFGGSLHQKWSNADGKNSIKQSQTQTTSAASEADDASAKTADGSLGGARDNNPR